VSATRVRTAWTDPEHVRLAMNRSPWDQNANPVEHGPLPPAEDPWLMPEQPEGAQDAATEAAE
jgi:hypothetical protein